MSKKKYYAVKVGKTPGIYETWAECQTNTSGFSGAVFKGFETLNEAQNFMNGETVKVDSYDGQSTLPAIYAFTDGSFNVQTGVYGFGGFLHYSDIEPDIELRGHDDNPEEAESRNVSGEVHGAVEAMRQAVRLNLPELTIFYDYEGVENWPLRNWKANKKISKFYVEEYDKIKDKLKVNFVHVKAHTGIPGNEEADRIAKEEVGLKMT